MGREQGLAIVATAMLGLGAWRQLPRALEPVSLPCAAEWVGRAEGVARCAGAGELTGGERRVLGLPLDVNRATQDELEALPGIGKALAARILEYRTAHGPFGKLDELAAVSGIGAGKLRLLAGRATVQAASQ